MTFQVQVNYPEGLHARVASKLATALEPLECQVHLTCNGKESNGRGLIGLILLGAKYGDVIDVTLYGADEQIAHDVIINILENNTQHHQ